MEGTLEGKFCVLKVQVASSFVLLTLRIQLSVDSSKNQSEFSSSEGREEMRE